MQYNEKLNNNQRDNSLKKLQTHRDKAKAIESLKDIHINEEKYNTLLTKLKEENRKEYDDLIILENKRIIFCEKYKEYKNWDEFISEEPESLWE